MEKEGGGGEIEYRFLAKVDFLKLCMVAEILKVEEK